ncbi:MAG: M48 family metallopeptidase [Methylotenera sp.]|nr:M48 family metallopeptidase [Methylotenera sp.]
MTQEVNALLFSPQHPHSGKPVRCSVTESALLVHELPQLHIAFNQIKAEVGGFHHDQLQLHWQADGQHWMLSPANTQAQKQMVALLPVAQIVGLKGWKASTVSQSTVWKSLWIGAGTLLLVVGLIVWQYDRVLDWTASKVSLETEKKIGDSVLKSLDTEGQLLKEGAAVDAVAAIGNKLTAGSRYHYRWLIANDDSINAFAVPSGIIVVNKGLLKKADNANELAAVLAHEVQHVELRHSLKNMINSAGIASVVLLVLGDANAMMMIIAHQVSAQFFSRQVEAEADIKGLELLEKHQMQREGMPSFFKKIADEYKEAEKMPAWLSSHPETLERIKNTQAFIKQHPCTGCVASLWDKTAILKDVKTRFKKEDEED